MNMNFPQTPEMRAGLEAARRERAEIFTGLFRALFSLRAPNVTVKSNGRAAA